MTVLHNSTTYGFPIHLVEPARTLVFYYRRVKTFAAQFCRASDCVIAIKVDRANSEARFTLKSGVEYLLRKGDWAAYATDLRTKQRDEYLLTKAQIKAVDSLLNMTP